jgi:glutamyl-tRNA reductase
MKIIINIIFFLIITNLSYSFIFFKKNVLYTNPKLKLNNYNKLKFSNKLIEKIPTNDFSVIGISLYNNTIKDIEKILINKNKLPKFYKYIYNNNIADEIVVLSTCNRFEIYTCSFNSSNTKNILTNILLSNIYGNKTEFKNKLYNYDNCKAFKHLCKVTSGLDSVILGEKQIEEQVLNLYNTVIKKNNMFRLNKLFSYALKCSNEIRQISNFNNSDYSIASVSVDLILPYINNSSQILIVGSGNTSKLLINYFRNRKINNLTITNRNNTNALKLKNFFPKLKINLVNYKNLSQIIGDYNYIFFATSSDTPIIKYSDLKKIENKIININKTITIIDLGLPKNVEKTNNLKNIYIHDIDSLKKKQLLNLNNFEIIMNTSKNIIDKYIIDF